VVKTLDQMIIDDPQNLVDLLFPGLEELRYGLVIQVALMVLILGRHCEAGIDLGEQLPI
jgi:hypothetical protein